MISFGESLHLFSSFGVILDFKEVSFAYHYSDISEQKCATGGCFHVPALSCCTGWQLWTNNRSEISRVQKSLRYIHTIWSEAHITYLLSRRCGQCLLDVLTLFSANARMLSRRIIHEKEPHNWTNCAQCAYIIMQHKRLDIRYTARLNCLRDGVCRGLR